MLASNSRFFISASVAAPLIDSSSRVLTVVALCLVPRSIRTAGLKFYQQRFGGHLSPISRLEGNKLTCFVASAYRLLPFQLRPSLDPLAPARFQPQSTSPFRLDNVRITITPPKSFLLSLRTWHLPLHCLHYRSTLPGSDHTCFDCRCSHDSLFWQ